MSREFTLRDKLAAALAIIAGVPFEHRKVMTADQVISLFQFDHDPHPHTAPFNGPSLHWNCTPRLILDHRHKTATKDVPMIYRVRRGVVARLQHEKTMAAKVGIEVEAPRAKPKKRWPKGRKLQSRNTFADRRRLKVQQGERA